MTVVPYLRTEPTAVTTLYTDVSPGDDYLHVHTILIVIIFCTVCFLLLVAFFYTFCFRCTLGPSPKDGRQNALSLEREDATYRRSSSSLGNAI